MLYRSVKPLTNSEAGHLLTPSQYSSARLSESIKDLNNVFCCELLRLSRVLSDWHPLAGCKVQQVLALHYKTLSCQEDVVDQVFRWRCSYLTSRQRLARWHGDANVDMLTAYYAQKCTMLAWQRVLLLLMYTLHRISIMAASTRQSLSSSLQQQTKRVDLWHWDDVLVMWSHLVTDSTVFVLVYSKHIKCCLLL